MTACRLQAAPMMLRIRQALLPWPRQTANDLSSRPPGTCIDLGFAVHVVVLTQTRPR